MKITYIKVEQPIGTFFLTSMDASVLDKIAIVERRIDNPEAVQRELSDKRIKEIAKYCGDSDATFPTPIIIAVNQDAQLTMTETSITFDENSILGEVIDGQHRLGGLKTSNYIAKFQVPVVLMFNLYQEEKAYVFSIINSKQTRVNMSLIYDLFALSKNRSPYKTCHEIARALNKQIDSPFKNRLKMLGKKTEGQQLASLSQGTFIKYLLELISRDPDEDTRKLKRSENLEPDERCVLRNYFIDNNDAVILKVLLNLFNGVKDAFLSEWDNPGEYIISKSIGFGAIIKAYPEIHEQGRSDRKLNQEYFRKVFSNFRGFLEKKEIQLTSEHFGSNEQARTKLCNLISESLNTVGNN